MKLDKLYRRLFKDSTGLRIYESNLNLVYINRMKKIYNVKLAEIGYCEAPQYVRENNLITIFKFKKVE